MSGPREHWEKAYRTKAETELSWFQARPERSLALIREAAPESAAPIIDIGGGASRLADELLAAGYTDVTVLDLSEAALAHTQARLGAKAASVHFVAADITRWMPARQWSVWHDRAVFHFLADRESQDAYIHTLLQCTAPGATIIIATFALDGPARCSGLPVQRYSAETLAARVGRAFQLVKHEAEVHTTPAGRSQAFSYCVFRRS
ncbi:MAG: class I SAM-dependent methyltransferase [Alphaproteobacteria bacterium]